MEMIILLKGNHSPEYELVGVPLGFFSSLSHLFSSVQSFPGAPFLFSLAKNPMSAVFCHRF